MSNLSRDYDAVIVGASIAGCATAIQLARRGATVALVERNPDPSAYKATCSHYIQPSAVPVLERMALLPALARVGSVRTPGDVWARWGWIRSDGTRQGLNIRRRTLDPLLREAAANAPGVELMLGETVTGLERIEGRVAGVETLDRSGERRALKGRLVVAADGRSSKVAELARVPAKVKPNSRFAYWAYYAGLNSPRERRARIWYLDPEVGLQLPTDNGLTLLGCMTTRDRLPEFKRDRERALERFVRALPDGPAVELSRASRVMGKLDMPNLQRPAAARGIAFVGDAALAVDPLPGVGCGFALQSAEWLSECAGDALASGASMERPLRRYRRRHRSQLAGHAHLIADYSSGRSLNRLERLLFSAAAVDPVTAHHVEAFASRTVRVRDLLAPRALVRAARHSRRAPDGPRPRPQEAAASQAL